MKMVKSLLLGSAAGLVAIAGAQAADLPVKAKPVQYVKICSLYGVGFYYIPGTDMCIKVGGWARYENGFGYAGSFTTEFFDNNTNNRSTTGYHQRWKGTATFDARSPTEYGTVRSYIAIGVSTNVTGANDGAAPGEYNNRWFIQWAGFTIGHSTSFFDFYSIGANQYGFATASSDSGDGGWTVFGYTAQFGNGLSATISAESQRVGQIIKPGSGNFYEAAPGRGGTLLSLTTATGTNYEAQQVPDVVANLRVDQAWGSAQIMGALHEVSASYYGSTEGSGHPSDQTGFAIGAGIKLNAPMIGKGDYLQAEVDYTEGASRYSNFTALTWNYVKYDGDTIGYGLESDAVFGSVGGLGNGDLELTTTWAVNAAYTHFWAPAWKSTLWGSYRAVNYNDTANALLCGGTAQATAGCDNDWASWGLGLRTEWAVSSTFQIGLEVLYAKLQTATPVGGEITQSGANGTKPGCQVGVLGADCYRAADQDQWAVRLRLNRNFYP
jgi:Porin subfamily